MIIEKDKAEFQQLDVLQFVYSGIILNFSVSVLPLSIWIGHGIYKSAIEQGECLGVGDGDAYFRQRGHFGDCILNTDGTTCSLLNLEVLFARAVNKDTLIVMFLDMCRTE